MKLNIGSGNDYLKGFVNLDNNPLVKADCRADIFNEKLPFKDSTFDYVLARHIIEHIPRDKFFKVMEEIWRVCKPDAIIDIFTPHFTSLTALKVPYHTLYFGIGSFRIFEPELTSMSERYSSAVFRVEKERLHLVFNRYEKYKFLSALRPLDFIFNINPFWQQLMERCFFIGFDEYEARLRVIK